MTDDILRFDDDTHTYTVGDVVVPSVTQILKPWSNFSKVPERFLKPAIERGKAVHLACQLDDENDLDEDTLDDSIRPYLEGWRKFKAEQKFEPTHIEERVYSEKWGFAGTLDRRGTLDGHKALLDIKSGVKCPTHGPQTAAYAVAASDKHVQRFAVYLHQYGTYDFEPYRNHEADFGIFIAALTYHNWRREHGI